SLNNGARQAARFAVVGDRACDAITSQAQGGAETIGMAGTAPATEIIVERPDGTTFGCGGTPATGPCTGTPAGSNIEVTMTYSGGWVIDFPPFNLVNAPTLTGTGVMRCEFS